MPSGADFYQQWEYFANRKYGYISLTPRVYFEEYTKMQRRVQFQFCFPPIYGIYDTGDGIIYVFGDHDGKIEDILSHEVLHWAVQKVGGKTASLDLDNVPPKFLRV